MKDLHLLPVCAALAALMFALPVAGAEKAKIKVACMGDSTTHGAGAEDKATQSYPLQLQTMLGDGRVGTQRITGGT